MTRRALLERHGWWRGPVGGVGLFALAGCIGSAPDLPSSAVPLRIDAPADVLPVVDAVAVVAPETQIALQLPLDRAAAARRGAARAARGSIRAGMGAAEVIDAPPSREPFDVLAGLAIVAGIVVAPVASVVGAVGGAAAGTDSEAIAAAEASLAQALADHRPADGVAAAVIEAAVARTGRVLADCGDVPEPEACVLADSDRPAVLLRLDWMQPFFAIEGEVRQQFRLVQKLEGSVLEAGYSYPIWRRIWVHKGPPADYLTLAVDDARLFRAMLVDARSDLVDSVVADLFPVDMAEPRAPAPPSHGGVWTVLPPGRPAASP
jgi:hypothetical protein